MKRGRIIMQRAMITLGLLLLLAPLAGCAQQRHWTKQGLDQAEFDQDAAQCRREAAKATYADPFSSGAGQGLERSVTQEKFFEQCMLSKGYRFDESGR
jgi:hypothetical protein